MLVLQIDLTKTVNTYIANNNIKPAQIVQDSRINNLQNIIINQENL